MDFPGPQRRNLKVHISDAHDYLLSDECAKAGPYDAVLCDASYAMPSPLLTLETYQRMASLLRPGGVLVQNLFWRDEEQWPVIRNAQEVFSDVYVLESEFNKVRRTPQAWPPGPRLPHIPYLLLPRRRLASPNS